MSHIAPAIMMVMALGIAVANAQDQFLQAPVYHVGDTWKLVYRTKTMMPANLP